MQTEHYYRKFTMKWPAFPKISINLKILRNISFKYFCNNGNLFFFFVTYISSSWYSTSQTCIRNILSPLLIPSLLSWSLKIIEFDILFVLHFSQFSLKSLFLNFNFFYYWWLRYYNEMLPGLCCNKLNVETFLKNTAFDIYSSLRRT